MGLIDLISVLMMLIAIASTVVSFSVYRASTDPEVIVYVEEDRKRPSVLVLIIKNIGSGPATDISFHSDRPLPTKAFGIGDSAEMPAEMNAGPLIVGVPYLAPGQDLVVTWGQYHGLKKFIGNRPIEITTKYSGTKTWFSGNRNLQSASKLDIVSFELVNGSDHNWDKKIAGELEKTNKELAFMNKTLNEFKKVNKNQNGS
jgi:hypothetical protein